MSRKRGIGWGDNTAAPPGPNEPCPECNSRWCDGPGQDIDPVTGIADPLCWRARRDMRRRELARYADEKRERATEILNWIGDEQ